MKGTDKQMPLQRRRWISIRREGLWIIDAAEAVSNTRRWRWAMMRSSLLPGWPHANVHFTLTRATTEKKTFDGPPARPPFFLLFCCPPSARPGSTLLSVLLHRHRCD